MKKMELHMDALIAIIFVFFLCFGVILFQRYQFSDLLQDNIDLTWDNENLKVNLDYITSKLDECNKLKIPEIESTTGEEQTGAGE